MKLLDRLTQPRPEMRLQIELAHLLMDLHTRVMRIEAAVNELKARS